MDTCGHCLFFSWLHKWPKFWDKHKWVDHSQTPAKERLSAGPRAREKWMFLIQETKFPASQKESCQSFYTCPTRSQQFFQNSLKLRDDTATSKSPLFISCLDMQGQNASPKLQWDTLLILYQCSPPCRPPKGRFWLLQKRGWVHSPQPLSSLPSFQSLFLSYFIFQVRILKPSPCSPWRQRLM